MAETESDTDSDATICVNISEYDPELDFYSEKFNPLKAIECSDIRIPIPNAPIYDNLAKYNSVQLGLSTAQKKKEEAEPILFERKFEPHQMPIKIGIKKQRTNVITRMEGVQGPLALLKQCVDNRTRIKIWIRRSNGIRGYCIAFPIAFDKHWNMALEDVTEVWTRPRSRKSPALDSLSIDIKVLNFRKKSMRPPKIKITKSTKKREYCERHIPQLLVRGEQIVFINILK